MGTSHELIVLYTAASRYFKKRKKEPNNQLKMYNNQQPTKNEQTATNQQQPRFPIIALSALEFWGSQENLEAVELGSVQGKHTLCEIAEQLKVAASSVQALLKAGTIFLAIATLL